MLTVNGVIERSGVIAAPSIDSPLTHTATHRPPSHATCGCVSASNCNGPFVLSNNG